MNLKHAASAHVRLIWPDVFGPLLSGQAIMYTMNEHVKVSVGAHILALVQSGISLVGVRPVLHFPHFKVELEAFPIFESHVGCEI